MAGLFCPPLVSFRQAYDGHVYVVSPPHNTGWWDEDNRRERYPLAREAYYFHTGVLSARGRPGDPLVR